MRKKREWYKGATYHIMNRGVNHQAIYKDQSDFQYFIALLKFVQKKYPFILHAYCIMTNHYHLLLETAEDEIWKIMKIVNQTYAGYFNDKYGRDGAVFRGRYHAVLVKSDVYFIQIVKYIILNPVKANMVRQAEEYPWSSYRTYLNLADDGITSTDKSLGYFKDCDRGRFHSFIEEKASYIEYEEQIQKEMREDDVMG